MVEKTPVVFPYDDFHSASVDNFVKIGGPAEAFRYMEKGYKEIHWRKRSNRARIIRELSQDSELRKSVFQTLHKKGGGK